VLLALVTDLSRLEWADLGLLAGLGVLYLLLAFLFPTLFLRPISWLAMRTLYRIHTEGRENIPATGPVLLLSNHVTYIDWLLIWYSSPRPVRFVAWAGWLKNPLFRWFLKRTNSILIDGEGGPKQIVRSLQQITAALEAGEVVCLFPEGALTRAGGQMLPFRRGFEKVVRNLKKPVPIVPVCLNQLWGSIFSYSQAKVLLKKPERIPYPVEVLFGKALPTNTTALDVRAAIQDLSAESTMRHSNYLRLVHSQFVRTAASFRHMRRTAWIDASSGTPRELSYLKALVASLCIRNWLSTRVGKQKNVGIWLPTSVGGALANVAMAFEGRTTVNLNYTAGTEAARSAIRQTGLDTVITSKKFCSRMPFEVEGVNLVYLEEAKISKWLKIKSLLTVALLPGWFIDRVLLKLGRHKLDDTATIIFSSGSTGEPKGVVLSHRNIASNCAASVTHLKLVPGDRLLGVLPFFHSFGYTVLLWFPLQIGASALYYPDPRQAKEVGELCKQFRCTGLLSTATFLRFYLRRCEPDDFRSLRLIICGAEKLPVPLAKEFEAKFGILPMEGYGCTELSPVVSSNISDEFVAGIKQIRNKIGTIGQPIPGVATRIIDPNTDEILPLGSEGMLWIRGANVTPGYLNRPDLTAKVIKNGWYCTGDVAKIDEDGFITITGRLSRFAKIGGEMVPLEKLEEELHTLLNTNDRLLAVSAVPDDRRGERLIVMTLPGLPVPPRDLIKKLPERGLPNLWIPGERDFFEVPELPCLGSGKLDLKRVAELAKEVAFGKPAA
jgi:acyl-[acyl-carrier-protein]-phospholipid O-acyltransferase/long-chain-fatty-acid--[acyl-carrier-protein] ligase